MSRLASLWLPGICLLVVSLIESFMLSSDFLQVRGGLAVAGLFGFIFALALSAVGISLIDQTRSRLVLSERRGAPREIAGRPERIGAALFHFYTVPYLPSGVLSLAVGLFIVVVMHGLTAGVFFSTIGAITISSSELALIVLALIVGSVEAARGERRSAAGAASGIAVAAILGGWLFDRNFGLLPSLISWGGTLLALLLGIWVLGRKRGK